MILEICSILLIAMTSFIAFLQFKTFRADWQECWWQALGRAILCLSLVGLGVMLFVEVDGPAWLITSVQNLDLVFKAVFLSECVLAVLALIMALHGDRRNWRSTVAGIFILVVSLAINGLHFHRTGQAQDLIGLVQFMAVGIGFLFAADAD